MSNPKQCGETDGLPPRFDRKSEPPEVQQCGGAELPPHFECDSSLKSALELQTFHEGDAELVTRVLADLRKAESTTSDT